jgi:hypothetical protein
MSRRAHDPFAIFSDSLTISLKLAETMIASSAVIGARGKIIDHAMTSPATADLPELWQMVSEKMLAFSEAWLSMWMGGLALSRSAAAQGQDAQRLMTSGRMILPSDMLRLADRSSRAGADLVRSGGKALAPIHKAATGNARRLRSPK